MMEGNGSGAYNKAYPARIAVADLRVLSEDEMLDLLDRLRSFIRARYGDTLNADDLAIETLLSILDGHRHCNPDFDLFQDLCWKVRSIASNQLKKRRREKSRDESLSEHDLSEVRNLAEEYEAKERTANLLSTLLKACAGDASLMPSSGLARPRRMGSQRNCRCAAR